MHQESGNSSISRLAGFLTLTWRHSRERIDEREKMRNGH
jgi:hypothetical protein